MNKEERRQQIVDMITRTFEALEDEYNLLEITMENDEAFLGTLYMINQKAYILAMRGMEAHLNWDNVLEWESEFHDDD